MSAGSNAEPAVTMNEAQAYVRIETGEEEAVLAGLIRSASSLCEAFLGRVVVARPFVEELPATTSWQRLATTPVQAITGVEMVGAIGATATLASGAYAIDIDANGDGWLRLTQSGDGSRLRVRGSAGMAAAANDVPEPIRQGVLRLVAHLFANRDGGGGQPPAAVTALWRPYRRMVLR